MSDEGSRRLHVLQHVPFEGPATIAGWARERGYRISTTPLYAGAPLPPLGDVDFLVVMGGPMNVDEEDRHPWLAPEKRFIERAVGAGKTVLGVCLGAQLIAAALGAGVYRNRHREIGWFPVELEPPGLADLPASFEAFHWHGDTFDLPRGAVRVARSAGCENQAFVHGDRVVALQFHLEVDRSAVDALLENCREELASGLYVQTAAEIRGDERRFAALNEKMRRILDRLAAARR